MALLAEYFSVACSALKPTINSLAYARVSERDHDRMTGFCHADILKPTINPLAYVVYHFKWLCEPSDSSDN